jgi:hypothetical protein
LHTDNRIYHTLADARLAPATLAGEANVIFILPVKKYVALQNWSTAFKEKDEGRNIKDRVPKFYLVLMCEDFKLKNLLTQSLARMAVFFPLVRCFFCLWDVRGETAVSPLSK